MNYIKNVPAGVLLYYQLRYPQGLGYSYRFYIYTATNERKIYGCLVFKEGIFYHNATQATEDWYNQKVAI